MEITKQNRNCGTSYDSRVCSFDTISFNVKSQPSATFIGKCEKINFNLEQTFKLQIFFSGVFKDEITTKYEKNLPKSPIRSIVKDWKRDNTNISTGNHYHYCFTLNYEKKSKLW